MAQLTLLEFIDSEKGRAAIIDGVDTALNDIKVDLPSAVFGGTELAFSVTVAHHKSGTLYQDIIREHITCDVPDPEGGEYDYRAIADQKQGVSIRTGLSMRETKLRDWLRQDDVQWIGNAVLCLDKDGDTKLIVSCSGLSDLGDEAAAERIAAAVKWHLLRAFNFALAA